MPNIQNMNKGTERKPLLTVIVVFHNMQREAERTLYSLSTDYQSGVSSEDYQVLAIDNGSAQPLAADWVNRFGPNFRYQFFATDSVSPASAINYAVNGADSEFIAVIVDGARMVSPGVIRESLRALRAFSQPFVGALGWHLGMDVQNVTILEGYDQAAEDCLLDSIGWQKNGYRLFEISTLAQSSNNGFLGGMPNECSWFAMPCSDFIQMGGYDERFQSPGGGQVNHDFLGRVLQRPEVSPVVLLGEGSFHQVHGGVATNVPLSEHPAALFKAEYLRIHGRSHQFVKPERLYYMGGMPVEAHRFISYVGDAGKSGGRS